MCLFNVYTRRVISQCSLYSSMIVHGGILSVCEKDALPLVIVHRLFTFMIFHDSILSVCENGVYSLLVLHRFSSP